MARIISCGKIKFGARQPVFITAEVGINHNGDMKIARKLIAAAADSGADAVKLQSYITEQRAAKDSPIYGILKQCELSFKQQAELFRVAADRGLTAYSTPFDRESVDFLSSIKCPLYKVASFDVPNHRLLQRVAATGKPVIISRGLSKRRELDAALKILGKKKTRFAVLHCISAYPVKQHTDLNLRTIAGLAADYNCPVGFSDHSIGYEASMMAVAAGAELIEKHFTINTRMKGPDHALSTDPATMKKMIAAIRRVEEMLGTVIDRPIVAEKDILQYRRITRIS